MYSRLSRFALTWLSLGLLGCVFVCQVSAQGRSRRGQIERRTLELEVGEQTTVSASGVQRYSEGVPGIIDVRVPSDGRQFILVALRAGTTSLLLIREDGRQIRYTIRVRDPNAAQVVDPGSVPERENVRLDLYFVQLSESYSHQIGLSFPGTIGGAGVGRSSLTLDLLSPDILTNATASIVNQVLPRLDLAQSQGWARVRRQAMLVTTNGAAARFSSGGEVNIPVQGALTAEIRSIEFGSEVRVTPRYDSDSGRVELSLVAEVSDLTSAGSAGVPGRTRTRLQTIVNLEPGQAMVLGGLNARTESETQGGIPGLSQIPFLGVLFGNNNRQGESAQNFIFIVPTVVQAVPRSRRDYVAESLEMYRNYEGSLEERELIERSPPGYR